MAYSSRDKALAYAALPRSIALKRARDARCRARRSPAKRAAVAAYKKAWQQAPLHKQIRREAESDPAWRKAYNDYQRAARRERNALGIPPWKRKIARQKPYQPRPSIMVYFDIDEVQHA